MATKEAQFCDVCDKFICFEGKEDDEELQLFSAMEDMYKHNNEDNWDYIDLCSLRCAIKPINDLKKLSQFLQSYYYDVITPDNDVSIEGMITLVDPDSSLFFEWSFWTMSNDPTMAERSAVVKFEDALNRYSEEDN